MPKKVTYNKSALTFEQQLEHLIDRGLIVKNPQRAIKQLTSISYYRLSAYWHPFRKRNHKGEIASAFTSNASFDEAIRLYEFDRKLRLLVLDAIERVEVSIRTKITYHIGHKYGAFGYLYPSNFHEKFNHALWLSRLRDEVSRVSDEFVRHYKRKYKGYPDLPIWMMTEVMSLGTLSFFYRGLKNSKKDGVEDKKLVADYFNLHYKRLENWLHVLTYARNVCAHHSRLWNRKLAIRPDRFKRLEWLPPITPSRDRVFYVLLILRRLLGVSESSYEWANEVSQLIKPIAEVGAYRNAMGLPNNWLGHPIWGCPLN